MKPMKKLFALSLLVLPMLFVGPRDAAAGVCEDNRDFCLAGCTSWSSPNCRTKCLTTYVCCKGERQCPTSPGGGGPNA